MTHGTKFRPRSARNVVDEIEYLYKKYNHRYFSFVDDNLTFNKARTLDICNEIIYRGLDIQFDTPNGLSIKHLDKEAMDGLVKAGLIRVCVAPESGSDFIRNKVIRKGLSRNEIYSFFDIIKDYKELYVKAFFVIGFPEETSQTLNDTYEMIKQIPVQQISIFNAVPFPGTPLFEQCKREGLIDIPLDNLHNLDTFANYNESDTPFIKPYKLKLQSLMEFRQKAYDYISHRNPRNSVSLLNKNG
jgi:magnesium-protoporphyrin IX monomethyl ester (oxidative) cyclase